MQVVDSRDGFIGACLQPHAPGAQIVIRFPPSGYEAAAARITAPGVSIVAHVPYGLRFDALSDPKQSEQLAADAPALRTRDVHEPCSPNCDYCAVIEPPASHTLNQTALRRAAAFAEVRFGPGTGALIGGRGVSDAHWLAARRVTFDLSDYVEHPCLVVQTLLHMPRFEGTEVHVYATAPTLCAALRERFDCTLFTAKPRPSEPAPAQSLRQEAADALAPRRRRP